MLDLVITQLDCVEKGHNDHYFYHVTVQIFFLDKFMITYKTIYMYIAWGANSFRKAIDLSNSTRPSPYAHSSNSNLMPPTIANALKLGKMNSPVPLSETKCYHDILTSKTEEILAEI